MRQVVFLRLPEASLPQDDLQASRDLETQAVQLLARGGDRVPAPRHTDSKPKGPQETAVWMLSLPGWVSAPPCVGGSRGAVLLAVSPYSPL